MNQPIAVASDVSVARIESREQLDAVKQIHREHKSILGQMPDGGFEDRFSRGQIYLASLGDTCAGYVLFWTNQSREVRIAHLAVSSAMQHCGVAKALLDRLKSDYSDYARIRLNCRSDFAAAQVWPKLDFVACGRKPAKTPGRELTVFQYRLNDAPLFDAIEASTQLPVIVCDANVCMDIEYEERDHHESSSGLLADWLVDAIDLQVTPEILNDFDRQDQVTRNRMTSSESSTFNQTFADVAEIMRYRDLIRGVLGNPDRDDDLSDEKHLAIAAAASASAFATGDHRLLSSAPELFAATGLRVLRPSQIIAELDSLLSSDKPHFGALKDAGLVRSRVTSVAQVDVEQFIKSERGETIGDFRRQLDNALASPKTFRVERINTVDGKPLVVIVSRQISQRVGHIERLRIAHRVEGTRLAAALAEHLSGQPLGCVWTNRGKDRSTRITHLTDRWLAPNLAKSSISRGSTLVDGQLTRLSMPGLWTFTNLISELDQLVTEGSLPSAIAAGLKKLATAGDAASIQRLEQRIHPGKVDFGDLPTWIVPIQPEWAQELFDIRIWDRPLFSAETNLVIHPDSVYYKRPKNSPTGQAGRILWYVSGEAKKGGNLIRACSSMTKRVTGPIKDVFRQHERLGVFEWKQIKEHFGDANAEAVAIEFTDTELLPNPISFHRTNEILQAAGMNANQFQSALRISPTAFQNLYQELTEA